MTDLSGWELALYMYRVFIISLGGFTIGFALYVAFLYQRGHLHAGSYHQGIHVTAICFSYILLAAGLTSEIAYRALRSEPITWRLPLATAAFLSGIWALYQLVHTRARDPHGHP